MLALKYLIIVHLLGCFILFNSNLWGNKSNSWKHLLTFTGWNYLGGWLGFFGGASAAGNFGLSPDGFTVTVAAAIFSSALTTMFLSGYLLDEPDNDYVIKNRYRRNYLVRLTALFFLTSLYSSITTYLFILFGDSFA